ncbi:MAG: TIGR01212 family radical SAM protein [Cellulosilyticaceae bacterium]
MMVYNKYADYLKNKYGDKVYKIPINIPVTCPNRDGNCGKGGCTFCSEDGAGYEMLDAQRTIQDQLQTNIDYIGKRYKAKYFIAYLQNYSNTYMPITQLHDTLEQIKHEKLVGISISTRPDCISDDYLMIIKRWADVNKLDVCIELGLQTVNYHTLDKINRGHSLGEYLDASMRIKAAGFQLCTHLILNLPWDNTRDVIESAKVMSAIHSDYVKLHALYIVKNTPMGKLYLDGQLDMISLEEYKKRVILFLRNISPDIIIQRIIGRAPSEYTLFANWNTSWWKIHDDIVKEMEENNWMQGDLCNYLNGPALRKFNPNNE